MNSNLEKLIDETVNALLDGAEIMYVNELDLDDDEGAVSLLEAAEKVVSHVWQREEREQQEFLSAAVHVVVAERVVRRLQGINACSDLEELIDETVTDLTDREEFKDVYDVIREMTAVRLRAAQEKVVSRISQIEEPAQHGLFSAALCAAVDFRINVRSGIDDIDLTFDENCADLGPNFDPESRREWFWREEMGNFRNSIRPDPWD